MYVDGIDIAHDKIFYYEYKLVNDRVFIVQDPLFRVKDVPELMINESKLKCVSCKSNSNYSFRCIYVVNSKSYLNDDVKCMKGMLDLYRISYRIPAADGTNISESEMILDNEFRFTSWDYVMKQTKDFDKLIKYNNMSNIKFVKYRYSFYVNCNNIRAAIQSSLKNMKDCDVMMSCQMNASPEFWFELLFKLNMLPKTNGISSKLSLAYEYDAPRNRMKQEFYNLQLFTVTINDLKIFLGESYYETRSRNGAFEGNILGKTKMVSLQILILHLLIMFVHFY